MKPSSFRELVGIGGLALLTNRAITRLIIIVSLGECCYTSTEGGPAVVHLDNIDLVALNPVAAKEWAVISYKTA